jgi:hypothetical protein
LVWEVGSLSNQIWSSFAPVRWIMEFDESGAITTPWYQWVPELIAAGWVHAINEVQELVQPGAVTEGGAEWGAQLGTAAEQTEERLTQAAEDAQAWLGEVASTASTIALGFVGLAALVLVTRGRR